MAAVRTSGVALGSNKIICVQGSCRRQTDEQMLDITTPGVLQLFKKYPVSMLGHFFLPNYLLV